MKDRLKRGLLGLVLVVGCADTRHDGEMPAAASSSTVQPAAGASAVQIDAAAGSGTVTPAQIAGPPTFTAIYKDILTKGATGNCMFGACHGGEANVNTNGGLRIPAGDQATAYKNLMDVKSIGLVCAGKTYVIPGDSQGSLLMQKLSMQPPCGSRMPIGTPLSDMLVAQIAAWIDKGAPND